MPVGKFIARASVGNDLGLSSDQFFLRETRDGHFVWFHAVQAQGGGVVGGDTETEAWVAMENWAAKSRLKMDRS